MDGRIARREGDVAVCVALEPRATREGAPACSVVSRHREGDTDGLPLIVYVPDLARFLRISEKAVRHRAARGQVPRPFKSGKALAWTREDVLTWLRECGRAAGPAKMKITLRPYANDKTRFHVDIRFMHPAVANEAIRRRLVAPPGLDERQARAWGERQVPLILRELVGGTADAVTVAQKEIITMRAPRLTLAEFYERRFLPEHVALQKRATRDSYESLYRNHIGPQLGDVPIAVIDEDRISEFRAALHKRVGITTANVVLGKLAKILKKAKKLKAITVLPDVERFPVPRARPKPVFSDVEIARLSEAAADRSPDALLVCLLALDANLRVSEICALQWTDINLEQRTITVQHNVYKGEEQTPKGEIKTIALSSGVLRALEEHRKRGELGPLVLYRRSQHTGGEWAPHTPHSIKHLLNETQKQGKVARSGPHLLRHSGLTRLANLGASVYAVQAMARHARLQTTQAYLHQLGSRLTREAVNLLDDAAAGNANGKPVAKRARTRKK
jgi:integrase/predicted DNA-binding transcriptional regulator AlpA